MTKEIEEIQRKIAALEQEKALKIEEKRKALRTKVEKILGDEGFDLSDVFPERVSKRRVSQSAGLYQDPANPENTWGGRGRKPLWLTEKLSNGARMEDFKVAG